jgi:hypothetical protein
LKEWTTPDSLNTPSTTNLEGEEIVDATGKDGKASMTEQVMEEDDDYYYCTKQYTKDTKGIKTQHTQNRKQNTEQKQI